MFNSKPGTLLNKFIDSVALLVNIISSGFALMNLATISKDNKPSSRIVLLKSFSVKGFIFYTNTLSKKGNSLENNKYAALNFYWKSLIKQIRIEGEVTKVNKKEAI